MITFALPWVLAVAAVSAMAVAALHWLSVRRPPERVLPTARFLPDQDVRAVSRTTRPSDILLLLLRILLMLLAGVAIAGPSWRPTARHTGTIVVVDDGITPDTSAIRQLVMGTDAAADRMIIVFADSAARLGSTSSESFGVDAGGRWAGEGVGTPMFPLAMRAAVSMVRRDVTVDSLDLHVMTRDGLGDSTTFESWRAAWNGRVTIHAAPVRTAPRAIVLLDSAGQRIDAQTVATCAAAAGAPGTDDVVTTSLAWHAARVNRANATRVDTIQLVRRDTASASAPTQIVWPGSGVPSGWKVREAADTAWSVAADGDVIDGPWVIHSHPDATTGGRAMAWFSNGAVAATETRTNGACVRHVALVTNNGSDVLLSPAANTFFDRLLASCDSAAAVASTALTERSVYGRALAAADGFRSGAMQGPGAVRAASLAWLTPLLLGLSLVVLLVEWWLRSRTGRGARVKESALPGDSFARARSPEAS